jgi:hypothetical protein
MLRVMHGMKLVALAFALSLAAAPLQADPLARAGDPEGKAQQEFKEGIDKIMRAFQMMLRAMPQYAAPEILENGDIIIRRRPPAPPERKPTPPASRVERT